MVKLYKIAWVALGLTLFLSCADNDSSNFPSEEEVAKKNSSSSNLNGSSSSNLGTASSSSGLVNSSSSNSSSSSTTDAASSSSVGNSSSSSTTGAASSSSTGTVSSSSVASSSSEATSGTFTDSRGGGKTYKWVKIDTQIWMAENLNHNAIGSKCGNAGGVGTTLVLFTDANTAACDNFGRLYTWETAIALPGCNGEICASRISANHQGVCPTGWHIPSEADWNKLMKFVNPSCSDNSRCEGAGTKLKAASGYDYTDFTMSVSGNGTITAFLPCRAATALMVISADSAVLAFGGVLQSTMFLRPTQYM